MILSVIITFSFYGSFPLSFVMLSFPWDDCLTSDFELIGDVTIVETSFLSSSGPRSWLSQLAHLIYPLSALIFGWETFACLEWGRFQMHRLLTICYPGGLWLGLPRLGDFHHLWGEPLLIRLHDITCLARLVGHTTFAPQHLGFLFGAWTLWRDRNHIYYNLWMRYTFWHMAPFNATGALIWYSTLLPLNRACTCHNIFDFLCNRHFSCRVLCLKESHFKFQVSRLLILWDLTIRLLSFKPFKFRLSNEKLRGCHRT